MRLSTGNCRHPPWAFVLVLSLLSLLLSRCHANGADIPLFAGKATMQERVDVAMELAALEQGVDDVNAQWIASASSFGEAVSYRRLIAMPLTEVFDPPMGQFSRGHTQTGDKMSLPKVFFDAIQQNKAEVPWLFEVRRIEGVTSPRVELPDSSSSSDEEPKKDKKKKKKASRPDEWGAARPLEHLDSIVGGPLDFRAPPNYIFLPWWMMRSLGLRPRDVVDVRQITNVAAGSMVKFRPLTEQTMKDMANPQAVLETELKHYSSLTKGSTIAFDYNKKRYWFEVAECRSAPRGEKKPMIKVQDCDVASDFLVARDTLEARKKKKKAEQEQ
ncbi:Ubiquitin fusion degradation protein 1 [Seminavis robusta]|uniref:Ubiquitin fusion degradation protein 1 n=1 Tax=Seminavis robusta TaxID=568900 RepID=A0A9N8DT13_9STRA|nr:Ubiquitin fusion degradation protein 1 [Seminavis robusta]|eukprot:Sro333_g119660.1 Ubiquitin fusion degradation protein 1 (329) ;mRNA; r:65875-66861